MQCDTNDTFALMSPYYGWFGQDTWRVTRNVTVTFGLRMEYERGATERYNRAISYFDPKLELPISAAAQAAYARNPIPELPASQFVVRGGSVYAGENGVPRELWRSELMWLPRISAAWQISENCCAGRIWHVLRHAERDESVGRSVWLFSPDQHGSLKRFGQTFIAGNLPAGIPPTADPFPVRAQDGTRFDTPLRDALGSMARVGQGFSTPATTATIRVYRDGVWVSSRNCPTA